MGFDSAQTMLLGIVLSDLIIQEKTNSLTSQSAEILLEITVSRVLSTYEDELVSSNNLLDFVFLAYLYQDDIASLRELILSCSEDSELIACRLGLMSLTKCMLDRTSYELYFSTVWKLSSGINDNHDMTIRKIGHVLGWGSETHALRHIGSGEKPQEIVTQVLYCILRHPNNYLAAVKCATQIPQNSEVITHLIGALVGLQLNTDKSYEQQCVQPINYAKIIDLAKILTNLRDSKS